MANRANPVDVSNILETGELTDNKILAYITDANAMVNDLLLNSGLASSLLTAIEKWLAAHMIASTRIRMAASEGAGGASITYTGIWGEGLRSTPYGQQVLALDSTGTFANMYMRKASLTAVKST